MNNCIVCGHRFGILEATILIKKSVKPKGQPNRYKTIGPVCDNGICEDSKVISDEQKRN
jgi:hypothetical protein